MKTLKFNYYDEFKCKGSECGDSCCQNWTILLTKREYLDFKKMDCSPELRAAMDSAFKRTKSGDDLFYAIVKLKEDGTCPILGPDKLCMLQKEKGASALTLVCSSFPRNFGPVGKDAIVYVLTSTCCHVVELLMKHPEGISLIEEEYDGSNKWINKKIHSGIFVDSEAKILPYIWLIKTAQLDILQNRDFTISERLLILGYYTQKVCGYLDGSSEKPENPQKIGQLGAMLLDRELCRKITDSLKPNQTDVEAAAKSTDILFKLMEFYRRNSVDSAAPIITMLDTIAKKLEMKYEITEENKYKNHWNQNSYIASCEVYRKIEEERPYIIENLLASLAFEKFSKDSEELWADYFSLAVLYNFLKMGLSAFVPENYNDSELAIAITNIVKLIINGSLVKSVTMQNFIQNSSNSLPYVAFLVG